MARGDVKINWAAMRRHLGLPDWINSRQDLRKWERLRRGPKMDKIRDNIYLGNSHDALHNKAELKEAGVTAILNVARDLTNHKLDHKDFEMYHVGFMDGGGNDPIVCGCALMLFNGLLRQGHKVLIHCHEGKSRSAAIVATHLMACGEYWDFAAAEAHLKSIRPIVDINPAIREMFTNIIQSSTK